MTDARPNQTGTDPTDTPSARIYLDFYQLTEAPFNITPDPEFLFSSGCHRQVLDKIAYAIDGRMGFVLLTGEVGTGKTTLCRSLLDRLAGKAETAYVINPSVSGQELLAGILEDAGAGPGSPASKKTVIDRLYRHLLADANRRPFVVIIDDAQTMSADALEDLRLLSNLETDKHKLIQVVLSGQPELLNLLDSDGLRQLKQRIAVHCRLEPLTCQETGAYISRRLFVAGNQGQVGFAPAATRLIHQSAGGIPRLINKICDYALTAGYVADAAIIGPRHVKRALTELDGLTFRTIPKSGRAWRYGLSAAAMLGVGLIATALFSLRSEALTQQAPLRALVSEVAVKSGPAPASTTPLPPERIDSAAAPLIDDPPLSPARATAPPASGQALGAAMPVGTALAQADGKRQARSQHMTSTPYALQLGSFRALENARQSVIQYRGQGVPAHWQMVDNGRWYRVVAGDFENPQQAARYQSEHGLDQALIIHAPLTVRVLPKQPHTTNAEIRQFLAAIGFDSLVQTGLADATEIYAGLFPSLDVASPVAERINRSDRFLAWVVHR